MSSETIALEKTRYNETNEWAVDKLWQWNTGSTIYNTVILARWLRSINKKLSWRRDSARCGCMSPQTKSIC